MTEHVMPDEEYTERLLAILGMNAAVQGREKKRLRKDAPGNGTLEDIERALKEMRNLGVDDMAEIVTNICLNEDFDGGNHLMVPTDGKFWMYSGRVWERVPNRIIAGIVLRRLGTLDEETTQLVRENRLTTRQLINEVVALLQSKQSTTEDLLGLLRPPPAILNCTNGELHLDTMEFKEHSYDSYLRIALDVEYDPDAKAPLFEAATKAMMSGSRKRQRHLIEVLGFALNPRKPFPAFFLFLGRGANGKSVLLELLAHIMGQAVRCDRLQALNRNNFSSNAIVGRSAWIDDDLDYKQEFPVAEAKKISERKTQGGEAKQGDHFDFICELTLIMGANGLPYVPDTSRGYVRRARVIKFNETWYLPEEVINTKTQKVADLHLLDKLKGEASGILNLLIAGIKRTRERGSFEETQTERDALMQWRLHSDSVLAFVESQLTPVEGAGIPMKVVRTIYLEWCQAMGLRAKGMRQITDALKDAGFTITTPQGSQWLKGYQLGFLDSQLHAQYATEEAIADYIERQKVVKLPV